MSLSDIIKEKVSIEVIKVLVTRFALLRKVLTPYSDIMKQLIKNQEKYYTTFKKKNNEALINVKLKLV